MLWFKDTGRLKLQKQLVCLNVFAATLNFTVFAMNILAGKWHVMVNLVAGLISAYIAYRDYRKLPEIKQEQEVRILNILRGKER